MDAKSRLRQQVRANRRERGRVYMEEVGRRAAELLFALPLYQRATTILLYCSSPLEVGTHHLLERAWHQGKQVALPRCEENFGLSLCLCRGWQDLREGAYGIREPKQGCPALPPERLELAVLPALACDRRGVRLGQGGGYYDRLLPKLSCPTVALCQQEFVLPCLPRQPWDGSCQYVLTQDGVIPSHVER